MIRRLIQALSIRLADKDAEAVRRNTVEMIKQLQGLPATGMVVLHDVSLANATATPIPHGLGRRPLFVWVSPVRGPSSSGRVEEVRNGSHDPAEFVVLTATGFGATVTVDVGVL